MNILTFDIEEWHIYEQYPKGGKKYYLPILTNLLDKLLDILEQGNIKATFFCLGIVARNYPEIIKKIITKGHEIGCHSDKHIRLSTLNEREFRRDLKDALASLEDVGGEKIVAYRAPAFSVSVNTPWCFQILAENGFKYDSSVFPTKRSDGGFPEFPSHHPIKIITGSGSILEFPINTGTILKKEIAFSGGGYFRLIPYATIKRLMSESAYTMSYFHLRDFDKKQKRVISLDYFKSYYGINGMLAKLERFINDHSFESIGSYANKMDTGNLPEITIE